MTANTRGALLCALLWATAFAVGMYFMVRRSSHRLVALESEAIAYVLVSGLLIVPVPAALGALGDQQTTGILVGLGIWLFVVAAFVFLLSNAAI